MAMSIEEAVKQGREGNDLQEVAIAAEILAEAYERDQEVIDKLKFVIQEALKLKGGWRESIVELEDHCREPVRLKNMIAAADQLDEWAKKSETLLKGIDQGIGNL